MALSNKQKKRVGRLGVGAPLFTSWHNPPWDHPILACPYYRPPLRFWAEEPTTPTDIFTMPPGVTASTPASSSTADVARCLATNIAKIMEYLGYFRGTGSDPSGNHEGVIGLQHWMENYSPNETLFQSSKDILTGSALAATDYPTHSWFTAAASASIITNQISPFLSTLRDECLARNLCFPLRIHQDIEEFDDSTWTIAGSRGWLQAAALDSRYSTEEVLPGLTTQKVIEAITAQGFDYDPSLGHLSGKNEQATLDFMWGIQHSVRSYALYRTVDAQLPLYFGSPHCLTSNYNFHCADGNRREQAANAPHRRRRYTPIYQSMPGVVCYPATQASPEYIQGESPYSYYRRYAAINLRSNAESSQRSDYRTFWSVYPGSSEHDYTITTDDALWLWDVARQLGYTDYVCWAGPVPDWDLYLWTINRFLRDQQLESPRSSTFFGLREHGHQRVQP